MANAINIHADERAQYRRSLLTVVQAALMDEGSLMRGFPSGGEISDCLSLVMLMDEEGGHNE